MNAGLPLKQRLNSKLLHALLSEDLAWQALSRLLRFQQQFPYLLLCWIVFAVLIHVGSNHNTWYFTLLYRDRCFTEWTSRSLHILRAHHTNQKPDTYCFALPFLLPVGDGKYIHKYVMFYSLILLKRIFRKAVANLYPKGQKCFAKWVYSSISNKFILNMILEYWALHALEYQPEISVLPHSIYFFCCLRPHYSAESIKHSSLWRSKTSEKKDSLEVSSERLCFDTAAILLHH